MTVTETVWVTLRNEEQRDMLSVQTYLIIFIPYGLGALVGSLGSIHQLVCNVWMDNNVMARDRWSWWYVVLVASLLALITLPLTAWLMEHPSR